MTLKKTIICVIIMGISAGIYGCDFENSTDADENPVVLKWVTTGLEEQKDSAKVWRKFNEELQKYIPNTVVEFECYSTNDYAEKWKLKSVSQEKMDIVWCGWSIDYVTEVKKGMFMPLDNLIDEYAPDLKKEIPEKMLQKQMVDGKLYSIPCMQQMVSWVPGLDIRLDLYEKYKSEIDLDKIAAFFASHKKMDKACWDEVEKYIKLFYDNGDLTYGIMGFKNNAEKGYEWVRNPYKIEDFGDDYTPINYYRTPEYKLFTQVYSQWYKKGYIKTDVVNADNKEGQRYVSVKGSGGYLIGKGYFPSEAEIEEAEKMGTEPYVSVPFCDSHYIPYAAAATAVAIPSTSENPERAIKLIELMNTEKGKDLYNLLVYGIEGEHYKKVTDNEIIPCGYDYTGVPTKYTAYGQYKWVVGNTFNAYEIYGDDISPALKNEFIKKVNDDAVPSKLMGFTLDTTPIKNELKQIDAVVEEYVPLLNSGTAENPDALYNEFVDKLIKAGDDNVTEEIARQINEWKDSEKEGSLKK
ncbi:MAG: ABC transporter substrate-binding protein [Clostridia bacterium]|nr:ABC transporter substrate-binding protein [Clostridia bacterium]